MHVFGSESVELTDIAVGRRFGARVVAAPVGRA
jgi:hypothetical protein